MQCYKPSVSKPAWQEQAAPSCNERVLLHTQVSQVTVYDVADISDIHDSLEVTQQSDM